MCEGNKKRVKIAGDAKYDCFFVILEKNVYHHHIIIQY